MIKHNWFTANTLWLVILALANSLLLAPDGAFFRVAGSFILLLLPGLAWAETLRLGRDRLTRSVAGLGLSYALVVIFGLLLFYVSGPVYLWMVLSGLNFLVLSAILVRPFLVNGTTPLQFTTPLSRTYFILLAILLVGASFRFIELGYREFEGDEVKPMFAAAEAIEGHEDAIFVNRKKGPGEILLPMMLWRLTGTIDELAARIPFALAGVLAFLTIYLITSRMFGNSAGLAAAGLLALNGFMVGFSRILQYQQIVIWMSLLAMLCAWEWRQSERKVWGILTGIFLGVGVLFHYDAILVIPALIYLLASKPGFIKTNFRSLAVAVAIAIAIVTLFLWPLALRPQAAVTTEYVGDRIFGQQSLLSNNIFDFFHYTIFYNSFYYVIITGLLLVGLLGWLVGHSFVPKRRRWLSYVLSAIVVAAIIFLSVYPKLFYVARWDVDLAFLPFFLILLAAFLSPAFSTEYKIVIVWLATTFLGYTFLVNDPRTHFYTVTPAWVMLAAPATVWLWRKSGAVNYYLPVVGGLLFAVLIGGYLYIAFFRKDVEYRVDWPDSRVALYWLPYSEKPRHHFGYVSNVGWKAVGGLYAGGQLEGRYETNSGSGLDLWYGRQVNWGCGCCGLHKYYFAFDYKEIDYNQFAGYKRLGQIRLPANGKGVTVYSSDPASPELKSLTLAELHQIFDDTAWPSAFASPRGENHTVDINIAGLFNLTGYELIAPKPDPGEELAIILRWQRAENYQPINFDVFVQLEDAAGNIWGRSNGAPVCGQKLTSTWTEEEIVTDAHLISIDPNTPPGDYLITVGMYLPDEDYRLPILDEAGQPIAEAAELTTVTIE